MCVLQLKGVCWLPVTSVPNAVEDEEELDEDAAEGQDTPHDNARDGLGEERLLWDLPGNLIGSDGLLDGLEDGTARIDPGKVN